MILHPDRFQHLPSEFQSKEAHDQLLLCSKRFREYQSQVKESIPEAVSCEADLLNDYQLYLKTKYKRSVRNWEKVCRQELEEKERTLSAIQAKLDKFKMFKDCKTFEEFQVVFMKRFEAKDQAYEDEKKEREEKEKREESFIAAFGQESDSEE